MNKPIELSLVTLVLVLFSVTCFATEADKGKLSKNESAQIVQTVKLYEGVLKFPTPHWIKSPKEMGNMNVSQSQTKNTFTIEIIPKDQEFENWTNMYGVYGFYLPEYDMKRFVTESLNALGLGCGVKANTVAVESDNGLIMIYHCDDLVEPLVVDGNNVESGFLYMAQVGHSFAKIYQAWRGSSEDKAKGDWPINEQLIKEVLKEMESIQYFNPDDVK